MYDPSDNDIRIDEDSEADDLRAIDDAEIDDNEVQVEITARAKNPLTVLYGL